MWARQRARNQEINSVVDAHVELHYTFVHTNPLIEWAKYYVGSNIV